jgi:membrane protein
MKIAEWKAVCKELIDKFFEHRILDLAAQLSFYFLLSLFPFLIFVFALLAYLPFSTEDVLALIAHYVPANSMDLIERNVRGVLDVQRGGLLSISILFTLWSSSNAAYALMRALNDAYEVGEGRPFLRARLVALLLTFALLFVILIALLLPVFGRMIGLLLVNYLGMPIRLFEIWDSLRWVVSIAALFIVFCGLYYFAPNRNVPLTHVWVGALVATLGWQATSFTYSYYVSNFANFTATYGSLGGIVGLLLWFYLSSTVLLLGGEVNAVFERRLHKR